MDREATTRDPDAARRIEALERRIERLDRDRRREIANLERRIERETSRRREIVETTLARHSRESMTLWYWCGSLTVFTWVVFLGLVVVASRL